LNLLKVFQMRLPIILILSFSLLGGSIFIPNSSAQEDIQIPDWIKSVAGWWANDEISENEFSAGIEYLINNNIISLNFVPCHAAQNQTNSLSTSIPNWIKNNAKWWSEDLIGDIDFTNGIEYLIEHKIIKIDNKKILGQVPLENVTSQMNGQLTKISWLLYNQLSLRFMVSMVIV